ncbi:uncharacterized protein pre-mod(mdg4)-W [Drosophila takahashii]|uniref:uncharacterized protein pre-mod(mdg4)-W n=1 Tax=Drosophila takahashii TaxID=29030 RepID=UPI0007E6B2B6|nr:uncharacterized protein LOC108061749 [Drosophila takahashii]
MPKEYYKFCLSKLKHLPVDSIYDKDGNCLDFFPNIRIVRTQQKKVQLLYKKYPFTKSNNHGDTIYWHCRSRRHGRSPCKARFMSIKLKNGRYKVFLSQPEHNHPPTKRRFMMNY